MLRDILAFFGLLIVLIAIVTWLIRGGPERLAQQASAMGNPISGILSGLFTTDAYSPAGAISMPYIPLQGIDYGTSTGELQIPNSVPENALVYLERDPQSASANDPESESITIDAGAPLSETIELNGWSVQSSVSGAHIYISHPLSLAPGERVIIYTGGNPAYSGHTGNLWQLYIGSSADLWGNEHDSIRLLDPAGTIVDTFTY